ncbi:MAG: lysophospholipid acyltransferase family protein [Candidatus Falkowbacteria bacterium]
MKNQTNFVIAQENTISGKILKLVIILIIAPIFRLIFIKKVDNKKFFPKSGAVILAANHQSYLDFISLVSVLPNKLHFLAAEKFFESAIWRQLMLKTGQIKVDRGSKDNSQSIELAQNVLKSNMALALFPQGTRSRTGQIEKTFTGVARFAMQSGCPVIPVGIRGAFEVLPPGSNKMSFAKKIELHFGRPIMLEYNKNDIGNKQVERKLTNQIMIEIGRLANLSYTPE